MSKEAPVGFRDIRVRFELDIDAPRDQVDALVRLTDRYCLGYQSLASPPRLSAGHERTSSL